MPKDIQPSSSSSYRPTSSSSRTLHSSSSRSAATSSGSSSAQSTPTPTRKAKFAQLEAHIKVIVRRLGVQPEAYTKIAAGVAIRAGLASAIEAVQWPVAYCGRARRCADSGHKLTRKWKNKGASEDPTHIGACMIYCEDCNRTLYAGDRYPLITAGDPHTADLVRGLKEIKDLRLENMLPTPAPVANSLVSALNDAAEANEASSLAVARAESEISEFPDVDSEYLATSPVISPTRLPIVRHEDALELTRAASAAPSVIEIFSESSRAASPAPLADRFITTTVYVVVFYKVDSDPLIIEINVPVDRSTSHSMSTMVLAHFYDHLVDCGFPLQTALERYLPGPSGDWVPYTIFRRVVVQARDEVIYLRTKNLPVVLPRHFFHLTNPKSVLVLV
uniref:Uncharacterized protein n=1 Tax=Mycena chlorophos TaxID=658473 RepID=A0ABQ0LI59_MYCCL|nr:predicted protein [Mycena chlorophos]